MRYVLKFGLFLPFTLLWYGVYYGINGVETVIRYAYGQDTWAECWEQSENSH